MLNIQSLILGIIQGLTEFIPISSSAHLIIVPWLFNWSDPALNSLSFDVALHLGTLLALIVYFASDWIKLIRAGIDSIIEKKIGGDMNRRLAWFLVIGCIPGGIAGYLFESKIDEIFHSDPIQPSYMIVLGIIIVIMGALLFLAERVGRRIRKMENLSLQDSILIGFSQAFSVFPGVSRSGATITAGLFLGLEREAAARFSFLLSAPIIAGAGLKSLLKIFKGIHSGHIKHNEIMMFPIGFLAAAVSGYLCIKFLLRFLQKNKVDIFVYYRFILAIIVIIIAFLRIK